jgi:hypothetical protein
MAKPKTRKATPAEIAAYAAQKPRPLYPLRYFVTLGDRELAVEYLGHEWSKEDPQYEVMAPRGFYFGDDGTHTLLAQTLAEVRERVWGGKLEPCHAECGCTFTEEGK